MEFVQISPSRLTIEEATESEIDLIRSVLTFENKSARAEMLRFKNSKYWVSQLSDDEFRARLDDLKSKVKVCLLREDEGKLWTHAGLLGMLQQHFPTAKTSSPSFSTPAPVGIPWYLGTKGPVLRDYQKKAVEALLSARHGAVEIGTGLGKSIMILQLCKTLGLKTVIMAPTESIWSQLVDVLRKYLGRGVVGCYGAGKKDLGKLITVGIAASLTRIEPGSPAWDSLCDTQVFIADESHLVPAKTLESVCIGLCGNAPYRFFFSGTQLRGDGADMLLEGIIGKVQYSMTVKEGVDSGWLARPVFKMFRMASKSRKMPTDPKRFVQEHFLYNSDVLAKAGAVASGAALNGHQVLILIEEVEQMYWLAPHLKCEAYLAHGGSLSESAKKLLPAKWHKSDPKDLVEKLNNKEISVLVGTSCVNVGTDFQGVSVLINLQGGASEVKTRQSVGRGTRKVPGKDQCVVVDFFVSVASDRSDPVTRHCTSRFNIYNEIYPSVELL